MSHLKNVTDFRQTIIGYSRGIPIWQLMGAEEDASTGQSTGQGTEGTGQSTGTGTDEKTAGTGQSAQDKVDRADFDRLQSQLSASDRRREEAEQKAKQLEDKEKDELTRATDKVKEMEQSVQSLNSAIQKLTLENAFLKDSTYTWHDPSDVLKFVADDDSVSIGDDGKVQGMQAALKRLAEQKKYLVKVDDKTKLPDTPSGDPSNGGGDKGKGLDPEVLKRKYPALKR